MDKIVDKKVLLQIAKGVILGGITGIAIAFYFDLYLWLCSIIGGLIGFFACSPLEAWRNFPAIWSQIKRQYSQPPTSTVIQAFKGLIEFVLTCLWCMFFLGFWIGIFAVVCYWQLVSFEVAATIFITILVMMCLSIICFPLLSDASLSPIFPISSVLSEWLGVSQIKRIKQLPFCNIENFLLDEIDKDKVGFFQLFRYPWTLAYLSIALIVSTPLALLIVLDIVLTILMALASTKRIASFFGASVSVLTWAMMFRYLQWPMLGSVVGGLTVGLGTAYVLFTVHQWLDQILWQPIAPSLAILPYKSN